VFPPAEAPTEGSQISLDEFLAAILGEDRRAGTGRPAVDILREYSPDQPRDYWGRWTTDGGAAPGAHGGAGAQGEAGPKGEPAGRASKSAPDKVKTIENPKYSGLTWFLKGAGKTPGAVETEYGAIRPTIIPRGRNQAGEDENTLGAHQAHTVVTSGVPDGFLVGSEGAGPCIIAIVSTPSPKTPGKKDVAVSHFEAQDNPDAVWDQIGPIPEGTHVALAGGDGTDPESNAEMAATVASLAGKKGITIDGYFRGNGLWVDNKGRYFAYKTNVEKKK